MANTVHILSLVSSTLIGAILAVGAVIKFLSFRWFVGVIRKYDLAPWGTEALVALLVTSFELMVGVLLLVRGWLPWMAYGALVLLLAFTTVVFASLVRGKFDIACGCNAIRKNTRIGWHIVLRNLGLAGLVWLTIDGAGRSILGIYVPLLVFVVSLVLVSLPFITKRSCA